MENILHNWMHNEISVIISLPTPSVPSVSVGARRIIQAERIVVTARYVKETEKQVHNRIQSYVCLELTKYGNQYVSLVQLINLMYYDN
jgi:hypothetical protein